jgi:hypothetical protein
VVGTSVAVGVGVTTVTALAVGVGVTTVTALAVGVGVTTVTALAVGDTATTIVVMVNTPSSPETDRRAGRSWTGTVTMGHPPFA